MQDTQDDDYDLLAVPISALEHFSYCPRQCALIHLECVWDENIYTIRGTLAHQRVDTAMARTERSMRVERGLPLWSARLGLVGRADVVEFHGETPYPVEYKVGAQHGGPEGGLHEAIQLCAQGMCLEEMLGRDVPAGAIYYRSTRTRREVAFSAELRSEVEAMTQAIRVMLEQSQLPSALNDARCRKCSLLESCLPSVVVSQRRLQLYLADLFSVSEQPRR